MNFRTACTGGGLLLLVGGLCACSEDGIPTSDPPPVLTVVRTITLEESDTVVNMTPRVSVTPDGRILVAEPSQGNVRIHEGDGRLVRVLGRPGQGPGEFAMPLRAVGVGDRIWVLDLIRGFSEWDSRSGTMVREVAAPHGFSLSFVPMSDTLAVVGGLTPGDPSWRMLATVDLHAGEIRQRFMDHTPEQAQRGLAITVASVPVDVDPGGRIHALYSWSDTLRVFEADGTLARAVPVPVPDFSREGTLPDSATLAGLRVVRSIALAPAGRVVVHYTTPTATQLDERGGILLMDSTGTLLHRLDPAPPLLAVNWPELFFADSTGLHPAEITVMEYRD